MIRVFVFYSWRLCEILYEKHGMYDKLLFCYLDDPSRKVSCDQNGNTRRLSVKLNDEIIFNSSSTGLSDIDEKLFSDFGVLNSTELSVQVESE